MIVMFLFTRACDPAARRQQPLCRVTVQAAESTFRDARGKGPRLVSAPLKQGPRGWASRMLGMLYDQFPSDPGKSI